MSHEIEDINEFLDKQIKEMEELNGKSVDKTVAKEDSKSAIQDIFPSLEKLMNGDKCSDTFKTENGLTDDELSVLKNVQEKVREYKIEGMRNNIATIFKSLCDEHKEEILTHKIAFRDNRRIKFRGRNQCILRFLAYEEDYPPEVYDEILDCIYKLMNGRCLAADNKVIIEGVLEGLVNHNWSGEMPFKKNVREIKELMKPIVGQEEAVEKMLKCYNILSHTHRVGPHVIRIKAEDGMGVDTLVKTFASAIGRYCVISCQNLGFDPETTSGSSRVYCNSSPGELAEAIINNDVQVIILKNINDVDKRNISRLSAFFENTFIDNYFRVHVPGDVLVICTESMSGSKTPEYLFRDAYTIELAAYSDDECRRIANDIIERFNTEFGIEVNFDDDAMNRIVAVRSPKEIHKMLLEIFSNITYENEFAPAESVVSKKTITIEDLD